MNYAQRAILKTILRRLGRLQNEVKNPVILEYLSNASFELFEAVKIKKKNAVRYTKLTAFQAARMYQAGVPVKQIEHTTSMNAETIRRIVVDLRLPRRYKLKSKQEELVE